MRTTTLICGLLLIAGLAGAQSEDLTHATLETMRTDLLVLNSGVRIDGTWSCGTTSPTVTEDAGGAAGAALSQVAAGDVLVLNGYRYVVAGVPDDSTITIIPSRSAITGTKRRGCDVVHAAAAGWIANLGLGADLVRVTDGAGVASPLWLSTGAARIGGTLYATDLQTPDGTTLSVNGQSLSIDLGDGYGDGDGWGGHLILHAGNAGGAGSGGNIELYTGGSNTGATGDGGAFRLFTGESNATDGNGGNIEVYLGAGMGTGTGGSMSMTLGAGRGTGNGGGFTLIAGPGGDGAIGGQIELIGGDAYLNTGTAGPLLLDAGDPNGGTAGYVSIGANYASETRISGGTGSLNGGCTFDNVGNLDCDSGITVGGSPIGTDPGSMTFSAARLSAVSGDPNPATDTASASSVYLVPHMGSVLTVIDANDEPLHVAFNELEFGLSDLTAGKNYSVWVYYDDNDESLYLELGAEWTDDTTPSEPTTALYGLQVQAGDHTRRLAGVVRATSATTTADVGGAPGTPTKRFVASALNPTWRPFQTCPGYDNDNAADSYVSAGTTPAEPLFGGNSHRAGVVVPTPEAGTVRVAATVRMIPSNTVNHSCFFGVGVDGTNMDSIPVGLYAGSFEGNDHGIGWATNVISPISEPLAVGYHYLAPLVWHGATSSACRIYTDARDFGATADIPLTSIKGEVYQ